MVSNATKQKEISQERVDVKYSIKKINSYCCNVFKLKTVHLYPNIMNNV